MAKQKQHSGGENPVEPGAARTPGGRRAWQPPRIEDLPRLTELTLQTGDPIGGGGGTGGGGSVVF
jgi:hypothetical protein